MNYTKTLRAYCQQNSGKILDTGELHKKYFEFVPYKTFLKVLNRLRDEGLLIPISKGVWKITGEESDSQKDILLNYASNYNGMVVGYTMYNQLGITDHKDDFIYIYTNRIATKNKTIRNFKMKQTNHLFFGKEEKDLITILELIEHKSSIIDCDYVRLSEVIMEKLPSYSDLYLRDIVRNLHYQYATIITLERILKDSGNGAACSKIYRNYSIDA